MASRKNRLIALTGGGLMFSVAFLSIVVMGGFIAAVGTTMGALGFALLKDHVQKDETRSP